MVMVTSIEPSWVCALLQANDSFYPTGSYAHSFGLEGLTQEGVINNRDSLRSFLLGSAIPSLRTAELPIAAHAYRALSTRDWHALEELSYLASSLKTAREARTASENVGRQRAELLASLRAHPLAVSYVETASAKEWPFSAPISAGLEGVVSGAPMEAVLAGHYYSTIAALLASAMKLLRLGQTGCQTLLVEALSHAQDAIRQAMETELSGIGWFNPWLDIAAARHASADGRLFIS